MANARAYESGFWFQGNPNDHVSDSERTEEHALRGYTLPLVLWGMHTESYSVLWFRDVRSREVFKGRMEAVPGAFGCTIPELEGEVLNHEERQRLQALQAEAQKVAELNQHYLTDQAVGRERRTEEVRRDLEDMERELPWPNPNEQ